MVLQVAATQVLAIAELAWLPQLTLAIVIKLELEGLPAVHPAPCFRAVAMPLILPSLLWKAVSLLEALAEAERFQPAPQFIMLAAREQEAFTGLAQLWQVFGLILLKSELAQLTER